MGRTNFNWRVGKMELRNKEILQEYYNRLP